MIMYGGDSLNSSAGEISKLYESADQISESVQSFFADEEERKQKHGVKMIAFRNLGKTIRKKFHDSNSNLSHDDNKRGRRLSVQDQSHDRSQQFKRQRKPGSLGSFKEDSSSKQSYLDSTSYL